MPLAAGWFTLPILEAPLSLGAPAPPPALGSGPSFPTTPQAFSHDGQMFVAKIDPTLSGNASLVYAAKFGGGEVDLGNSIAVDHVGTVFVTGGTEGFHQNTVNAFQPTVGGG